MGSSFCFGSGVVDPETGLSAGEHGMHGYSLLGEMPHLFAQLPIPKAALAVLVLAALGGATVDGFELRSQDSLIELRPKPVPE